MSEKIATEKIATEKIEEREDVRPERGEHEYGNVEFADPTNKKYPIDTPEHIRAAWSYIHHKNDAAKYSAGDTEAIKSHIERAAKKHGITLHDE